MKLKNYRRKSGSGVRVERRIPHLKERVLVLLLELVGAEELNTTVGLLKSETLIGTLQELEHVVEDDGLQVNLFLVVEILGLQLDLEMRASETCPAA